MEDGRIPKTLFYGELASGHHLAILKPEMFVFDTWKRHSNRVIKPLLPTHVPLS